MWICIFSSKYVLVCFVYLKILLGANILLLLCFRDKGSLYHYYNVSFSLVMLFWYLCCCLFCYDRSSWSSLFSTEWLWCALCDLCVVCLFFLGFAELFESINLSFIKWENFWPFIPPSVFPHLSWDLTCMFSGLFHFVPKLLQLCLIFFPWSFHSSDVC